MKQTHEVHLLDLVNMLRRRLLVIISVVIILMAGAAAYVSRIPAQYTAVTTLVLNSRSNKIADLQSLISKPLLGIPAADTSVLRTEMEMISSSAMVQRVVEEGGLMKLPEFNPDPNAPAHGLSALVKQIPLVGLLFEKLAHAVTSVKSRLFGIQPEAPTAAPRDPLELIIPRIQRALSVTTDGVSYVLTIRFTSHDPHLAAVIANSFATIYLREQENVKLATTRKAAAWLGSRIQELEGEVLNSEREFLNFRAQHGLQTENGATLLDQQIAQVSGQLTTASAERLKADASLGELQQQIKSPGRVEGANAVLTSPLIQELRLEEARIQDDVAGLSAQFLPDHPKLQLARAKMREIQGKIATETSRIVASRMSQIQEARKVEASLAAHLADLQRQRSELTGAELKLRALERVANANRALYVSYLEKYKEIAPQEHSQEPDARLLSAASVPLSPSAPNRTMLMGAALVASTGFACALALLLGWSRSGVYGLESLEAVGWLRNFGLIPEVPRHAQPLELLLKKPSSMYSESVQRVYAELQFAGAEPSRLGPCSAIRRQADGRVVVVTSSLPGEGKSVFAASLARSIALAGKRTLLIDGDMRRPSVSGLLHGEPGMELSQFIVDPNGLTDMVATDAASGLHYLAARKERHRVHAVLNSPLLPLMLEEARARYDYIIIDTPPLVAVSDALLLSKLADIMLLVVRWEYTPRAIVEHVLRLLRDNGSASTGVLLTRVNMRKHARYNYGGPTYIAAKYADYA